MTETTTTPAGWYPDPQAPGMVRYWDGAAWTSHTAPGAPQLPPKRGLSTGAIVAIVIGSILAGTVLLGMLAAIAIPLFLTQQDEAMDAAAQADVIAVATEAYYAWVDHPETGPSGVREAGASYVIEVGGQTYSTHPRDIDTHLGEYVTDGWDYCVSVESGSGTTFSYLYSTDLITEGDCPALG